MELKKREILTCIYHNKEERESDIVVKESLGYTAIREGAATFNEPAMKSKEDDFNYNEIHLYCEYERDI